MRSGSTRAQRVAELERRTGTGSDVSRLTDEELNAQLAQVLAAIYGEEEATALMRELNGDPATAIACFHRLAEAEAQA